MHVEARQQHLLALPRAQAAARSCRRWWSCPSPGGRPSGSAAARARRGRGRAGPPCRPAPPPARR
jgi:hypothetical protein